MLAFGDVEVDLTRRVVTRNGEDLKLTRAEYNLLTYFLQNPDRALSRDVILNSVWGYESFPNTRTVDAHVVPLRQKLERDAACPQHFLTARSGIPLLGLRSDMARTILVVEDNDACRDALELTFAKLPEFKVRSVATAQQALDYLAADNICALVTDLHLGPMDVGSMDVRTMDGFDLIARVRSHPQHGSLPIVVISADSDPGTPARLAGIGANAYFSKPYSPAAVCRKLEQLVHAY